MVFYYLFDSITKKVSNINIILKYLIFEVISKKLNKKEDLFNCFDRF